MFYIPSHYFETWRHHHVFNPGRGVVIEEAEMSISEEEGGAHGVQFSQTNNSTPGTDRRTKACWITFHTCNKKGRYSGECPDTDGVQQHNNRNEETNEARHQQEDEDQHRDSRCIWMELLKKRERTTTRAGIVTIVTKNQS